jgi:cytochrome c-type biogenesis protein CcmH/NrfG
LIAFLVHALFDFNFHIPANALTAVTLMALVTSHLRFTSDRYWTGRGALWKILTTVVLGAAVVGVGAGGWRQWQESRWLSRAQVATATPQERLAGLEKAWSVDPENFQTAYELGETLRQISWQGDPGYAEWARRAIPWFERSVRLNPYDPNPLLRIGMCLDWLGLPAEAVGYFQKAVSLDPNNYYIQALMGWHHVQTGDFAAAKPWLERSIVLHHAWKNPIARNYLEIVDRRLKESGGAPAKP